MPHDFSIAAFLYSQAANAKITPKFALMIQHKVKSLAIVATEIGIALLGSVIPI